MQGFAIYEHACGFFIIKYEGERVVLFKKLHDAEIKDFGVETPLTKSVYSQFCEYLAGKRKVFDVPYTLHGTAFQKKVWQALCAIPYGETRSYKDIAVAVGNANACRAVGNANNKNPITAIVPCHRVIGASGKLVGYAGGLELKKFLLDMESSNK